MSVKKDKVDNAFEEGIMNAICPECGENFTDFAVAWGDTWKAGYDDCAKKFNVGYEKDGPYKIKCELCENIWLYNYWKGEAEPAES